MKKINYCVCRIIFVPVAMISIIGVFISLIGELLASAGVKITNFAIVMAHRVGQALNK